MRWVHRIPHKELAINIYETDARYSIKIEAGPMEQTYKVKKDVLPNLKAVVEFVDEDFVTEVMKNFGSMFESLKKSVEKAGEAN